MSTLCADGYAAFYMPTWITSGATTAATSECHDLHAWGQH